MKTDDLIAKLSAEHAATKPIASFWERYLKWTIISLLCVFTGVSLIGLREDVGLVSKDPSFIIQNIVILLGALLCSALALILSVPGSEKKRIVRYLAAIPFLLWLFLLLWPAQEKGFYPGIGMGCAGEVFSLGIIPGILLLMIIRRGATLERSYSSFFAFMGAAALGAFGVQFSCHSSNVAHLFVWHFLPVILLGILGIALAKKILKKI